MGGGSSFYTWWGIMCQFLIHPVTKWFLTSLVCSSHIFSQLCHFFPCCFPAYTLRLGISHLSFLFSVVNFLLTPPLVIIYLISMLAEGEGRTVGIVCVIWVVLATVPDRPFKSGSGSKPNRCQIGGPGRQ